MKALVAMSGGVDSSVAAALMLDAGYEVIGVTLKQWEEADGTLPVAGCCTVGDAEDARRVAAILDVPYYVLDYVDDFREAVVVPFGSAYGSGVTPNPCIECNRTVRFNALLTRTEELGCDVLVTGHHARIRRDNSGYHLMRAVDQGKDQSYVLYMLGQKELEKIHLPIGEMTKADVREIAANLGLRIAVKPDSQDLCFVGSGDYREFLAREFPHATRPGPIVDVDGKVLGEHAGTAGFTIGQRRGIGISSSEPRYVIELRPAEATVVVGPRKDLSVAGCSVDQVSFVAGSLPADLNVEVKVRYRSVPATARLAVTGSSQVDVHFAAFQVGIAPGQAAVFYQDDEVIGGGTITSSFTAKNVLPGGVSVSS